MGPFATAQEFAQYLGMGVPDDLARMQQHLELASGLIRRWCDQTLSEVTNDVIEFSAWDGTTLILPERPVTAVSSVVVSNVPFTEYRFTRAGLLVTTDGSWWSDGATVTYDHGYAQSDPSYLAIRSVCLDVASRSYTLNERSSSEAMGSTIMESAGYSPETFLTTGEKMTLADLGKVGVG